MPLEKKLQPEGQTEPRLPEGQEFGQIYPEAERREEALPPQGSEEEMRTVLPGRAAEIVTPEPVAAAAPSSGLETQMAEIGHENSIALLRKEGPKRGGFSDRAASDVEQALIDSQNPETGEK